MNNNANFEGIELPLLPCLPSFFPFRGRRLRGPERAANANESFRSGDGIDVKPKLRAPVKVWCEIENSLILPFVFNDGHHQIKSLYTLDQVKSREGPGGAYLWQKSILSKQTLAIQANIT